MVNTVAWGWGKSPRFIERYYTYRQVARSYLLRVRHLFVEWRRNHWDWWPSGGDVSAPDPSWLYDWAEDDDDETFPRLPEFARNIPHLAAIFAIQDAQDRAAVTQQMEPDEEESSGRIVEIEVNGTVLRGDVSIMDQWRQPNTINLTEG